MFTLISSHLERLGAAGGVGGAEGGGGIPASLTLSYLRPELKPCQVRDLLSPPLDPPGRPPRPDLMAEGLKIVLFLEPCLCCCPDILEVIRLTSAEFSPSLLEASCGEEADTVLEAASLLKLDWNAAVSVSSSTISRSGLDPPRLRSRPLTSLLSVSGL